MHFIIPIIYGGMIMVRALGFVHDTNLAQCSVLIVVCEFGGWARPPQPIGRSGHWDLNIVSYGWGVIVTEFQGACEWATVV